MPPHQSFPAPALQQRGQGQGWLALPSSLWRPLPGSSRHCWLAVAATRWTEEETSCWKWDPDDHFPATWPWRESAGEREPLLAKIHSAPTVGTSPLCQRMPGVPLLSGRDFRARCQPNSSCVSLWAALFRPPHKQPSQLPVPQSPAQAAHLLPLTHSVLQTVQSQGAAGEAQPLSPGGKLKSCATQPLTQP